MMIGITSIDLKNQISSYGHATDSISLYISGVSHSIYTRAGSVNLGIGMIEDGDIITVKINR
jgi:hypothetical protein